MLVALNRPEGSLCRAAVEAMVGSQYQESFVTSNWSIDFAFVKKGRLDSSFEVA